MYSQTSSLGSLDIQEGVRLAMRRVYLWMTLGLLITAGASLFAQTFIPLQVLSLIILPAIIVELVVVVGLSFLINKISPTVALLGFFFYAILNGLTLTPIFWVYTGTGIAFSFVATASMFGAMTVVGYTTQTDLTKFGSLLFMGLIGLIVASIINLFIANSILYWIISFVGVALFVGLTAYDTQWIKNATTRAVTSGDTEVENRVGVMGALRLYLDFINLFMMILRIAGGRRR